MPDYLFAFYYDDDDQVGVTGLTGTVDIKNAFTGASLETGLTPVEVGDGVYSVVRTLAEADYTGVMKTAANGWRASLSVKELPRIDAAVSSRLSSAAWTTGLASILAAIAGIPAAAWAWTTRTLTMTPAQVQAAMSGDKLPVRRGDTFEWTFTALPGLAGRTSLYLTAKSDKSKPDSAAIIQVSEIAGLLVLNGQPVESGDSGGASLQVLDEAAGTVKLTIQASATFTFPVIRNNGYYDIQRGGAPVRTIREGDWVVEPDVTWRIA